MPQLFSNGARAELANAISATDTSLTLVSKGELFPACNYAGTGTLSQTHDSNWIKLVLQDENSYEIVFAYMHEASTNVFSNLRRGQAGTVAKAWLPNLTVVGLRPIAEDIGDLVNTAKSVLSTLETKADKTGDITGNAATASRLKNAVAIGGVSFTGEAGINLPGVNEPGNQNTTGTANRAKALESSVDITVGGSTKSFNGGSAISFPLNEIGAAPATHSHDNATTSTAGFMSAADKAKLDAGTTSDALYSIGLHNGPRSSIATVSPGRIPADGQTLTFAAYPEVCNAVWNGLVNAVSQAEWASKPNCWGKGDGTTYVTVPNLNMADGSAPPFYLRGGPDGLNGTWVGDAIRPIVGETGIYKASFDGTTAMQRPPSGAFEVTETSDYSTLDNAAEATPVRNRKGLRFNASLVVPTAAENRVKTAYIVYTIRIYNAATNQQAIDIATVANDAVDIRAKLNALDSKSGFTIIYPNGGTAAAPANVAINSRYVMANPFPGFSVIVTVELRINGVWGDPKFILGSNGSYGTAVSQNGDNIVVQTGQIAMCTSDAAQAGHGFGTLAAHVTAPTPCRVKVWKNKEVV